MREIELILGTMMFGVRADAEESCRMMDSFAASGWTSLDTAHVYGGGAAETIIGNWVQNHRPHAEIQNPAGKNGGSASVRIADKVHPRTTGRLDADSVRTSFEISLDRLKLESIDLFYLHAPDLHHPVEDALEMCARLYDEGKFKRLGVSNFPAWLLEKTWHLCEKHGWPHPEVYQGMYNAITRAVEPELFPALRDLGMSFYAYNPLAGGLLTGKYAAFENKPETGRFAELPFYADRYWKKSAFEALQELKAVCNASGISLVHAALRWLLHHSALSAEHGDGIIVGASSAAQLQDNLTGAGGGPLPESVAAAADAAWETARCECPGYFRFYSG